MKPIHKKKIVKKSPTP